MAFIAPLIVAYIGLEGTAALVATAVVNTSLSIGAFYLAQRLTPQPSNSGQGTSLSLRITSNESREIAFGRCASAGSLKYHNTYGPNGNDYVQLLIVLADHECDGLEAVYVDGKLVLFDESGAALAPGVGEAGPNVQAGVGGTPDIDYSGNMWVTFHNGAWDQAADADLVAHTNQADSSPPPEQWTTFDVGRGVCYAVVTMKFDEKKFKNGNPPFLFVFRGIKLYDWRLDSSNGGSGSHRWGDESTYEWTQNPVVCIYNYRRGIFVHGSLLGGMTSPATSLPVAKWTAAANICDEEVDLLEGGTETRYTLNGIVEVQTEHATVLRDMYATMAGVEIDSGGVFSPEPGAAQSPVMSIADTDLMAKEQAEVVPKLSRSVLINAVFGTFRDPAHLYGETALPPRISAEDEATDGAPLAVNYSLAMVTSGTQGQRVLEILRRKGRHQRTVTATLRSRFTVLEPGDWVSWESDRYGWTDTFEVMQVTRNRDLTVVLELRQTSADIFSWNAESDELSATAPHKVGAGGSTFTTVENVDLVAVVIEATGGIERPGLQVTWDVVDDFTVIDLQLQYRKVGDTVAIEKIIMDPRAGQYTWIEGIQGGIAYEVRMRPVTTPEREVAWTAWIAMDDTTSQQIVDVALISHAVPPDTITAAMLAAQERFELALVTNTSELLGAAPEIGGLFLYGSGDSMAARLAAIAAQAENAAEAAIAGHLEHAGTQALIKTEETRRVTEDEVLASVITTVQADLDTANATLSAAIVTEQTARSTADTALATSISTETANRTSADSTLTSSVSSEATSRISGDAANASSITTEIANRTSGDATNAAAVSTEATARASADTSLATSISTETASRTSGDSTNAAAITTESTARASADTAMASSITSLTTTVGGHTTTLASYGTSIAGIQAQWGIVIDVDGNVVGAIQLDGGYEYSSFTVVVDNFLVAFPGSSPSVDPVPVFGIGEVAGVPKIALRGDMIVDGSILARHLDVLTLDAISANVGELTAGVIRSTNSKMIIDLDAGTIQITA